MEKIVLPKKALFDEVSYLLSEGREVLIPTKGNSMLPFIHGERDRVLLVNRTDIKKGDIVLARIIDSQYILHRIIDIDDGTLMLMGDGNLCRKETCHAEDIVGVVKEIIRPGDKRINVNSREFKFLSRLWVGLLPLRRYILAIYRRLHCRDK